jgi:hypothetical protein
MRTFFLLFLTACGSSGPSGPAMAAAGLVGAPCTTDGDCKEAGASCILPNTNSTWPGGYCTVKGCPATACSDASYCQEGQTALGNTTCFYKCESDANCRAGYKCCEVTHPAGTGVKVCAATGVLCQ